MAKVLYSHEKDDIVKAFVAALKQVGLTELGIQKEFLEIDEQLNSEQTAALLRISLPTLIKLRKEGKVPFYKVGRKIWHSKKEVLAAAKKNHREKKDQKAA